MSIEMTPGHFIRIKHLLLLRTYIAVSVFKPGRLPDNHRRAADSVDHRAF